MPLEDFLITVFCWVDERLKALLGEHRWRQRGLAPKLADSEVITMEGVGEFWGLDTDVGLWKYFRRHGPSWVPALGSRTTFAQPAAHLWVLKQRLHQPLPIALGAATDPIRRVDGGPPARGCIDPCCPRPTVSRGGGLWLLCGKKSVLLWASRSSSTG